MPAFCPPGTLRSLIDEDLRAEARRAVDTLAVPSLQLSEPAVTKLDVAWLQGVVNKSGTRLTD